MVHLMTLPFRLSFCKMAPSPLIHPSASPVRSLSLLFRSRLTLIHWHLLLLMTCALPSTTAISTPISVPLSSSPTSSSSTPSSTNVPVMGSPVRSSHHPAHHLQKLDPLFDPNLERALTLNDSLFDDNYNETHRQFEYFGEFFDVINEYYLPFHGYLSLLVCFFGIFANILNIVVLTRKEMLSATNAILTGLAVADLMVMLEYIPFTIHSSIEKYRSFNEQFSYPWAVFTLFHAHFSIIFHSISTWLTVILAIWRYTSVSFPTESKVWCSMSNAKLTIGLTYIVVPIICIPSYLSFAIFEEVSPDDESTGFIVNYSEISKRKNNLLKNINFWVFSVGLKLVPCILLTYLSLALIKVLMEAERRKQRLKSNLGPAGRRYPHVSSIQPSMPPVNSGADPNASNHNSILHSTSPEPAMGPRIVQPTITSPINAPTVAGIPENSAIALDTVHLETTGKPSTLQPTGVHLNPSSISSARCHQLMVPSVTSTCQPSQSSGSSSRRLSTEGHHGHHHHHHHTPSSQSDRTTKMLLAILLLFLITEFPSGVVTLLTGVLGESFAHNVYRPLGEIFDIFALVNSGINFILYCVMSRLFRKTFCKIFWPRRYHSSFEPRVQGRPTEKTNVTRDGVTRGGVTRAFPSRIEGGPVRRESVPDGCDPIRPEDQQTMPLLQPQASSRFLSDRMDRISTVEEEVKEITTMV